MVLGAIGTFLRDKLCGPKRTNENSNRELELGDGKSSEYLYNIFLCHESTELAINLFQ